MAVAIKLGVVLGISRALSYEPPAGESDPSGVMASSIRFLPEHRIDSGATLRGFSDYSNFIILTRGMVARGFAGEAGRGILGANFPRVFDAVCG